MTDGKKLSVNFTNMLIKDKDSQKRYLLQKITIKINYAIFKKIKHS